MAARVVTRSRHAVHYLARTGADSFELRAQLRREFNLRAPARLAVEERASRHGGAEHLLKAYGLRAELHLVGEVRAFAPALVFDRVWNPTPPPAERGDAHAALLVVVKLHHVRRAADAEPPRAEREVRRELHLAAALSPYLMHVPVQMPPLDRKQVLVPKVLKINERPLLFAEHKML